MALRVDREGGEGGVGWSQGGRTHSGISDNRLSSPGGRSDVEGSCWSGSATSIQRIDSWRTYRVFGIVPTGMEVPSSIPPSSSNPIFGSSRPGSFTVVMPDVDGSSILLRFSAHKRSLSCLIKC